MMDAARLTAETIDMMKDAGAPREVIAVKPTFSVRKALTPSSRIIGLLTCQNPAVLVRRDGTISGIITRRDRMRYDLDDR